VVAGLMWSTFQYVPVEPLESPVGETDATH
jgi:hypothetical protein